MLFARGLSAGARRRRAAVALVLASAIWLPALRLAFGVDLAAWRADPDGGPIPPRAAALLAWQARGWLDPAVRARDARRMRRTNPEWDFMARTFLVLAAANVALREPRRADEMLGLADRVIDDTLETEARDGMARFLLPYAGARPWMREPPRSVFVDGEIAAMLGARRLVRERTDYRAPFSLRVDRLLDTMSASEATACGESYPDECWTFCNTLALAAMRMQDALDGTDHRAFAARWVRVAKRRLIDRESRILHSAFTVDGRRILHGPEGSSIWMVAHDLLVVDAPFARDQYRRARRALARRVLGFAYAREWPESWHDPDADVDSGPILPALEASAGSSGLAVLGAAAMRDDALLEDLLASIRLMGFPIEDERGLRFAASNPVGDAVLLYALVEGPLWKLVRERTR